MTAHQQPLYSEASEALTHEEIIRGIARFGKVIPGVGPEKAQQTAELSAQAGYNGPKSHPAFKLTPDGIADRSVAPEAASNDAVENSVAYQEVLDNALNLNARQEAKAQNNSTPRLERR